MWGKLRCSHHKFFDFVMGQICNLLCQAHSRDRLRTEKYAASPARRGFRASLHISSKRAPRKMCKMRILRALRKGGTPLCVMGFDGGCVGVTPCTGKRKGRNHIAARYELRKVFLRKDIARGRMG